MFSFCNTAKSASFPERNAFLICYQDSGPYIISNATFPSYFQKDENAVIESHAMLDLTVFTQIATVLGITRRYVGEEPTSLVTGIYNRIMSEKLPEQGIECIVRCCQNSFLLR